MKPVVKSMLIVGWVLLVVPGSAAQGMEVDDRAPLEPAGLAKINATLQELVSLFKVQVANQRTQLAVQRLDIARRDVIARERDLHSSLTSRDSYEEQQSSLEARLEAFEDDPEAVGINEEDLEQMRRHAKIESDSLKQRVWRLDQRILDLQAELRRAREDLQVWEELVADSF